MLVRGCKPRARRCRSQMPAQLSSAPGTANVTGRGNVYVLYVKPGTGRCGNKCSTTLDKRQIMNSQIKTGNVYTRRSKISASVQTWSLQSCCNGCSDYPPSSFCESSHLRCMHHASYFWICVHAFSPGFLLFFFLRRDFSSRLLGSHIQQEKKKKKTALAPPRNTANLLSISLSLSLAAYLNKYIFLLACRHSCFESDECISSRSLLLQA